MYLNIEEAPPGKAAALPTPQPGKGRLRSSPASEKQTSHHGLLSRERPLLRLASLPQWWRAPRQTSRQVWDGLGQRCSTDVLGCAARSSWPGGRGLLKSRGCPLWGHLLLQFSQGAPIGWISLHSCPFWGQRRVTAGGDDRFLTQCRHRWCVAGAPFIPLEIFCVNQTKSNDCTLSRALLTALTLHPWFCCSS